MPGESGVAAAAAGLPSPAPAGRHVQLPSRRLCGAEGGWSSCWPALLLPPRRSPGPSATPVGLQPSQVSAPQGKAGRPTFPGPDWLLPAPVGGPLPRGLGRQTCASLDSSLVLYLASIGFANARPSSFVFHHSHFDFCLSKKVVTLFRQVRGRPA